MRFSRASVRVTHAFTKAPRSTTSGSIQAASFRSMKVATFNVNNINRRLPNLLAWLRQSRPDIVALQELKSTDGDFPQAALEKAGYGAVWHGQRTWNGVAILARKAEPVLIRTA